MLAQPRTAATARERRAASSGPAQREKRSARRSATRALRPRPLSSATSSRQLRRGSGARHAAHHSAPGAKFTDLRTPCIERGDAAALARDWVAASSLAIASGASPRSRARATISSQSSPAIRPTIRCSVPNVLLYPALPLVAYRRRERQRRRGGNARPGPQRDLAAPGAGVCSI